MAPRLLDLGQLPSGLSRLVLPFFLFTLLSNEGSKFRNDQVI